MKISIDNNFLFVHIPRTAGSSISAALSPFCIAERKQYPVKLLSKMGLVPNWTWHDYRMHLPLSGIQKRLPSDVYGAMLKFAVVRNPWDRMVSLYHRQLRRGIHRKCWYKRRAPGHFADYIRYEASRIGSKPGVTQLDMITIDNKIGTDRLLRFEHLYDDWARLMNDLGIQAKLPHWNRTDHEDWRKYYGDEEAELVATHWTADIKAFGYTFDT